MEPRSKIDAIVRRVRRALRDLEADNSIPAREKLLCLYSLQYELSEHVYALEPHADPTEVPPTVFSGDLI